METKQKRAERWTLRLVLSSSGLHHPSSEPYTLLSLPHQDAEFEEPKDVVYAQLCSRSLRQGTAVPPRSQAGEGTEEPSIYAALAVT